MQAFVRALAEQVRMSPDDAAALQAWADDVEQRQRRQVEAAERLAAAAERAVELLEAWSGVPRG